MDREVVLNWLKTVFADLLVLAEIPADETDGGLKFTLDQVQAIYDSHPNLSPMYANDLAAYYLLERLHASLLSVGARTTVDGDTFDISKTIDGIAAWMNRLLARIGWIVQPVEDVQSDVGKVVTIYQPYTGEGADEW